MVVQELRSGHGSATVTLSYSEIRELTNLLFHTQQEKEKYTDHIKELDLEFNILHELVKDGGLQMLVPRYRVEEVMDREEETT